MFFFQQKTSYEMRISDWSSDVCSSDLYFNTTPKVLGNIATSEPGVFYRDFEKETLKHGLIFASYPASREICAIGGIVNNNAGGEKSLQYGKTEQIGRA